MATCVTTFVSSMFNVRGTRKLVKKKCCIKCSIILGVILNKEIRKRVNNIIIWNAMFFKLKRLDHTDDRRSGSERRVCCELALRRELKDEKVIP